jgi:putative hydrolase of the HAD superfamily
MIDWDRIATVFLDMDGTLLDLRFDNHFWLEYVPLQYSEKHNYPLEQARELVYKQYRSMEGTLQWYCVDFWSQRLELDIAALKQELTHLIAVHPHVVSFLCAVKQADKRLVLLTNAHAKSVDIKLTKTGLGKYFDRIIISHELGEPKESDRFWSLLGEYEPHDPATTLFIDDNLDVLRKARRSGITHLFSVKCPDTQGVEIDSAEFEAIGEFLEILPPNPISNV